ncbi:TraR/DksA family transcriptional regulator [Pseudohongiella spirulinae]|uniref:Dimethylmenaquinone methyltransferase n=1 Tax=Pseudohongiella spirulinae TaxID=1249552 RepID=A0A0S2KF98_9GAMM|nr:TraR/DksA C4-type zinc finger protein [Pseudohongiella spirulinae]ALO47004.1 dimethylmenaquinone methyltransferase [Pseudohongiella spirulinae]
MDLTVTEQKLQALRQELTTRMEGIQADLSSGRSQDSEERAQENENEEVLQALAVDARNEIREIDAALARIHDGSYGTCTTCGEAIATARIDAYPMAVKCINCA